MSKKLVILGVSIVVCAGAALLARANLRTLEIPDYRPVENFLKLPDKFQFGPVTGIATDAKDNIFIFHRGKQPIAVFDKGGKFLRSWGDDLIKTAHGIRIDDKGFVWVTDIGTHLVMKFDDKGKLLLTLGQKNKKGDTPDLFNKPADVAVAPSGEFYVADGYGNSRVVKFSKDGKYMKEWGKKGKGEGEFNLPHTIFLDAKGRVYVGDRENDRVQVFDADGKFLAQWKDSGAPFGLYLYKGEAYIADGRGNRINQLNLDGKVQGRWGTKGKDAGQFMLPHWVCLDSQGAVYVAEVDGKRVQKFVAK
jgi:DNA-binding beta-propeller fold protein YncE